MVTLSVYYIPFIHYLSVYNSLIPSLPANFRFPPGLFDLGEADIGNTNVSDFTLRLHIDKGSKRVAIGNLGIRTMELV